MALFTIGYERRNQKKKWNSIVRTISNEQEVQRMLRAQAQLKQNREYKRVREAKSRNAIQINNNRYLNRQQFQRRAQTHNYQANYNVPPSRPRYEINEEQEIGRFRRKQQQAIDKKKAEEEAAKQTALGEFDLPHPTRPAQDLEFGEQDAGAPDPLIPSPGPRPPAVAPEDDEPGFREGINPVPYSDEALKNAITNLNISQLEQDQMYAILHKTSIINADIFGQQNQEAIESIRGGNFSLVGDAFGDGAKELRQTLVEDARQLLADTIPGVGFDMEKTDPDIYEPLDWKAIANKPTFTMLIHAQMNDLEYVFHIGTDPETGLPAIIDNTGAYSEIDLGNNTVRREKSRKARTDVIVMLMSPDERTKYAEEWWTTHINAGFKPDEVPRIPVIWEMFAQMSREFNMEMFKRYVSGLEEGSISQGADMGNVMSQIMSPQELQAGTMMLALSGGYNKEAPIPIGMVNERNKLEANIARTQQRYKDGEITFKETYDILAEQMKIQVNLENRENEVRENWTPVIGFDVYTWREVEEHFSEAKAWYDENVGGNQALKQLSEFGPFGVGKVGVEAILDPAGKSLTERVSELDVVSIPLVDDAINKWVSGFEDRLAESVGALDPDSDARFEAKAAEDKLMNEVKMYEAFLQLNGTMTERGMNDWAIGNLGGAYVGAKALMDITELGYTEVGHPIGEAVMPIIGDLIYYAMYPIEQTGIGYEKVLESGAEALGVKINVPSVGGFSQDVREVISGDVDLFFGIDSTEVAGEILNPANIFFIVPFVGVGSKFGIAVRAGRYLDAVAILVDELTLTGHSPEMVKGAFSGLRSIGIRGMTETLARSPGLTKNNLFQKWIANFGQSQMDKANQATVRISNKTTEDARAVRIIIATAGKDNAADIEKRLKPYSQSLIERVRREIDPDLGDEFKTANFFEYKRIDKGVGSAAERGTLAPAETPNKGFIARGITEERGGFRVDFTPRYQKVLERRREKTILRAEEEMAKEAVEREVSASGRNFMAEAVGTQGTRGGADPLEYVAREADEAVAKLGTEEGAKAAVTASEAYKRTPEYFPNLERVYGNYVAQAAKLADDAGERIGKEGVELTAIEVTEIARLSPSQLTREKARLEYQAAQTVLETPNPNAEQVQAFRAQTKRLEAVVNEEEMRHAAREWRTGLDDAADGEELTKRYAEFEDITDPVDLKTMTDNEIFQRHTELLIEAQYRGGHIELRFTPKGRTREGLVFDEITSAEQTLGQRGYEQIGNTFVKDNRKLGFANQDNASRVAAEIEQAKRGKAYGGTLVGGIKNAGRDRLLAVQTAALAARRGKTGIVRKGLDDLLDEIANELGNQRKLEARVGKLIKVQPEPKRELLPADADALRAEGSGEGAALPRADVDIDTATKEFTIKNAGAEQDVTVAVTDEFTEVTLSGGLQIRAKKDPNTGGIFIETMMPRGGKKALRQLEDGLWELKIMADDQNIIIRGWVQPFGRGKTRVNLDEAFDIFERNGYIVERTKSVRAGIFHDDTIRPYKEFEYRPYIREGEIPDPAKVEVAQNFEEQGDITTDFIDVDDVDMVVPGLPSRTVKSNLINPYKPRLGKTANGVWEGTLEEAKANLELVHDDLFGTALGLAKARKIMTPEEGKQLRHQWAKWKRIVDNGGVEDGKLEYLWRIQNKLEDERLAFQAKFSRHAQVPEEEAIEKFQRTVFDEAEESHAAKKILDEERSVQQTVSQKYDELDGYFDDALKDNWDKIKIAEAGRTFNEQNVVAVQFEQNVELVSKARPRADTGKKNLLKFTSEMDRAGEQAGGGTSIKLSKSLEDMVEQKELVDKEVVFLENKEIAKSEHNYVRDEAARVHALEQFEDYQSQLDETLKTFTRGDGQLTDVAPSSVEVRELSDAEKYADQFLVDPNRGDFGSSSIQEKVLLQDNRVGVMGSSTGTLGVSVPEPASGIAETFFDEVVEALISKARVISGNQKRTLYIREIAANESTTGMREVSIFGVTAKGAEKIKDGTWKGKNVGFPKNVAKFIKMIDGKTFKGNKKAFIDDIFKKSIIESGWSPGQRGRMQYLRQDAAKLDLIGAKDTSKAQRFFYQSTRNDLITGISYEIREGIEDLPNQVGRKLEAMNIPTAEMPNQNALLTLDGTFIDIQDQAPVNAMENAWNKMGAKNPDWDSLKEAALIHPTEEQAGKVTAVLDATGFVSITRTSTGLTIDVQGVLSKKQAAAIKKIVDDGDFAVVDLVHTRVYGADPVAANSYLAKLKVKPGAAKVKRLTELGISGKATAKKELFAKVDNLVDIKLTPLNERIANLDEVIDGAESFGTLPPNFSAQPNSAVQEQFTSSSGFIAKANTPLNDGYGLIFPDGTIWVSRSVAPEPRTGKGARKFQVFTGTIKDDVRQAFSGSYDMTSTEMDEFLMEFLNTTGAMRFKSSGGEVQLIVNRPPTTEQILKLPYLKNPEYDAKGYKIQILASNGEHSETMVSPKLILENFDEAQQKLARIETIVQDHKDGWEVLRTYRERQNVARKEASEVANLEDAREAGVIPKEGESIDVEDSAGDIVGKGVMTGHKKKSITYKDGRGKELTADVYRAHKQGPTQRPIVKKTEQEKALDEARETIVDEKEQIELAVREQEGKGFIIDNSNNEYRLAGQGDDIFDGRGMLKITGKKRNAPINYRGVKEVLDENRTIVWERAHTRAPGVDKVGTTKPVVKAIGEMTDTELTNEIRTLQKYVDNFDKRTTKYKNAVIDLEEARGMRQSRMEAGTWDKAAVDEPAEFVPEGMSVEERARRRERMLRDSVDTDILDDADEAFEPMAAWKSEREALIETLPTETDPLAKADIQKRIDELGDKLGYAREVSPDEAIAKGAAEVTPEPSVPFEDTWDDLSPGIPHRKIRDPETDKLVYIKQPENIEDAKSQFEQLEARMGELEDNAADRGDIAVDKANEAIEELQEYADELEQVIDDFDGLIEDAAEEAKLNQVIKGAEDVETPNNVPTDNPLYDPRPTNEIKFRREEIDKIFNRGIDKRTTVYKSLLKEKEKLEDILIYRARTEKNLAAHKEAADLPSGEQFAEDLKQGELRETSTPEGVTDRGAPEGVTDDVAPTGVTDEGAEQGSFIDEDGNWRSDANDFAEDMSDGGPPEGTVDTSLPEGVGPDGGRVGGGGGDGVGGPGGYISGGRTAGEETILQRAGKLRQKGLDKISNPKAKGDDFEEGLKLINDADELEASIGIYREVGSYSGELNSTEEAIERLRETLRSAIPQRETMFMANLRSAIPGMKPRKLASASEQESAKRALKTILARRKSLSGKVTSSYKRRLKLKDQLMVLEKGNTSPEIARQINLKKWEIIYEEQTTAIGVEHLSPAEQLQALSNEATTYANIIEDAEAGFMPEIAEEYARRRYETIDRSMEWIKRTYEESYLWEEKTYMAEQLYQTGMKAHRRDFENMRDTYEAGDNKIKDLIDKGTDRWDDSIQQIMKEQREIVDNIMTKKKDMGDTVQSLIFPKEGSGILPTFKDFENIAESRGFIGQHFEDVLNAQIDTWGLRTVLAVTKSFIGFVDNSLILRSDALGRKILALKKLENFARTQDARDANKITALGKNPFNIDKKTGIWSWGDKPQGYLHDVFENPEKFKHLFTTEESEYVKVITEVMENTRKFADFYGVDIPDPWKTANKVFRQVISSKNGIIDFAKLKKFKSAKPDPFYDRFYETILDGVTKGVRYEFDPGLAVIHQMQSIRSYAVHQAFMREVGQDFGVVTDVLKNKALGLAVKRWKLMTDWASEYATTSAAFLDGHTAKIPRIGVQPDSTGLNLPFDIRAIRERLLRNAKVTDKAERSAIAVKINEDAKDLVTKYKVGFEVDGKPTHIGLKKATADYAEDVGKAESRNTTKEAKRWGVRELKNEYPEGQALGHAPPQWKMPDGDNILFLTDDLEYLEKHWQDSDILDKQLLLRAGKVAGVLRIPQTALDWGFPLINGLNNWGYDTYRSLGNPFIKMGEPGHAPDVSAIPFLHPVFKLLGKKYKNIESTSVWGESIWQAGLSFVTEKGAAKFWTREAKLSPEIMNAYEKYGRVAGLPHEFAEFGTFEKAEKLVVGSIPLLKEVRAFERFQQAFTSYINTASYMYFKSQYHIVADNPKNLEALGALSRNMIGMHAGAELGIGSGQQAMERILFYAPSFTRASFAIMANATFQPTSFKGRQAIKSLAGLGESMVMITMGYSLLQQFEENGWNMDKINWSDLGDDMVKAWTPGAGFWGIEGASGIVGLGGAMRSNTQLIFRLLNRGMDWSPNVKSILKGEQGFVKGMTSDFAIHPDKWLPNPFREGPIRNQTEVTIEARNEAIGKGLEGKEKEQWINARVQEWRAGRNKDGFFDHPFMQWYRGKAGIISGNAWDIISGHDFLGYTVDPLNLPERMKQFLPFYLQAALESRQGDWKTIAKTIGLEFLGARVIPPSAGELKNRAWEEESGYTMDQLYELDEDGYQKHSGLIYKLQNDEDAFPKSVAATRLTEKTARDRGQDYAKFRDDRTRYYQERDAQIADLVADFDWNNPKHAETIGTEINKLYTGAQALVDEAKKQIFGDDGKAIVELWEGLDIGEMSPQAALDYADDLDNWTDKITKDIEWDIREAFINKHVQRLPPDERAIWHENELSRVGQSDVANYKAGKYKFVNEFVERRRTAGDDYGKIIDSGKYNGLTKAEGQRVTELVDTINDTRKIMIEQGLRKYTNKEMLEALLKAIPDNIIIQYAYMAQFDQYKDMITSTEKFDIIMANPDVVIFHPKALTDWSITNRQRELWKERWGEFGTGGGVSWNTGTKIYHDLYEDSSGQRRNFGFDVDVVHRPRSFGVPTTTEPYTEAGETAIEGIQDAPGVAVDAAEEAAGVFESVTGKIGEIGDEYLPDWLR